MKENEIMELKREITKLCKLNGMDEQFIDYDHEIDATLTYGENYNILKEIYNLKDKNDLKKYAQSMREQMSYEKWNSIKDDGLTLFNHYTPFCIAIIGERNSGKTALAHQTADRLRSTKKMPIYVYQYPKTELLNKIGYKNLKELRSLEYLSNIIFWIDEPQLSLKKYDKRNNDILMEILGICRHRNIILVISTSDTRWVNKALESYVDVWAIKDIDFEMIKQGARARYVIKQHSIIDPQAFKLDVNEYLLYYRKDEEYQGKFTFELPKYWNDEYSKTYSAKNNAKKSAMNNAKD